MRHSVGRTRWSVRGALVALFLLFRLASPLCAQTGENVLLVVNRKSPLSVQIADYYRPLRAIPAFRLIAQPRAGKYTTHSYPI